MKKFWHESKICDGDIEVHSFESMETVPAMEVKDTHSDVQLVVEEMKTFRSFFLGSLNEELRKFWLRKVCNVRVCGDMCGDIFGDNCGYMDC